jgi:hypothetical protein
MKHTTLYISVQSEEPNTSQTKSEGPYRSPNMSQPQSWSPTLIDGPQCGCVHLVPRRDKEEVGHLWVGGPTEGAQQT